MTQDYFGPKIQDEFPVVYDPESPVSNLQALYLTPEPVAPRKPMTLKGTFAKAGVATGIVAITIGVAHHYSRRNNQLDVKDSIPGTRPFGDESDIYSDP